MRGHIYVLHTQTHSFLHNNVLKYTTNHRRNGGEAPECFSINERNHEGKQNQLHCASVRPSPRPPTAAAVRFPVSNHLDEIFSEEQPRQRAAERLGFLPNRPGGAKAEPGAGKVVVFSLRAPHGDNKHTKGARMHV